MGNTVGTRITTLKEELGKKVDEAKSRIEETVNNDKTSKSETGRPLENNTPIPKISIYGSTTSTDLLDSNIIDKSLIGDIEISKDNFDGSSDIQKGSRGELDYLENESYNVVAEEGDSTATILNDSNNNNTNNSNKDNKDKKGDGGNAKKNKKEIVCVDDVCFKIKPVAEDLASYCVTLLHARFNGQTNSDARSDQADTRDVLNIGLYLKLVDKFLHQFENVKEFTGKEEEYLRILKLVSFKRKKTDEPTNVCFQRIFSDSSRFVKIYHKRGVPSEHLHHKKFWGSRQQMLSGKVIADYVDPEGGPLDPIFGVILQPTAGRVGPGDSSWIHSMLFDDTGYMAYHSAVHDAFGYLINFHDIGPGYNYLSSSRLDKQNPLSGQISGVKFWKEVISDIMKKEKVIEFNEI